MGASQAFLQVNPEYSGTLTNYWGRELRTLCRIGENYHWAMFLAWNFHPFLGKR